MKKYIIILLLEALLVSCGLGPEQWEPHVLTVGYIKNGQVGELDLGKTGPTLVIDEGENLEFLHFTLQLLPTRRSSSGASMTRVKDVPPVPESALDCLVRVSATMRKWEKSGPCYDKRDQLLTDWVPAQAEKWTIHPTSHSWMVRDDWDEIRINVHIKRNLEPEAEHTVNSVMLRPTGTSDRLRRNIGQNMFMRIRESLRGERYCSDEFVERTDVGDADAMYKLGVAVLNGSGVPKDARKAAELLRLASELGHAAAQNLYSTLLAEGHGVDIDIHEAVIWWRKSAEQGNRWAQYNLGHAYHTGRGVPRDYSQAAGWYHLAAEQDVPPAHAQLSGLYMSGLGVEKDMEKAGDHAAKFRDLKKE